MTVSAMIRTRRVIRTVFLQESVSKRKSMTGLGPSRTVTRYDADSPEADIDVHTDEMNLEIPERDGADASAGHDTFVAHQWGRKETPAKRIRIPRHNTNVTKLGNIYAVSGDNEEAAEDEVVQEATALRRKHTSKQF